jgi:adenine-specific DNA-methyltransferase
MSSNKKSDFFEHDVSSVPIEIADGQAELMAQIRELIPGAFPDGVLDQGLLLSALGLGEPHQAFTFAWPGMAQARLEGRSPTTATLVPDPEGSVNWDEAGDVLIEGDNLQVLKLLKNGYAGAVKLIYIDPPYNTGDSFTYNDDFSVSEKEYLVATGQVDEQGQATTAKKEKGGRKHAPWLTMMSARLAVARHLLRKDGVFLASIDNNEVHHLRLLLDAIFGAENFVDMITWQGGRKGDAKLTAGGQDYILIYARDRQYLKELDIRWRERKSGLEPVYAMEKELLQKHGNDLEAAKKELRSWFDELPEGNPAKQHSHYSHIDQGGVWTSDNSSSPNYRENLIYNFKGYPPPENGWRYELARMEVLDKAGRLLFPSGRATRIRIKKYLREQEKWAPASSIYRDRSGASSALSSLMGAEVFDDPKSTDVLARLFQAITGDGDLILDFFAGSGSSGQAVWEQNPKDGKTRRWILVQRPETPDATTESGKNALAAGYKTIFDITAGRLRRAAANLGGGLGFRLFRARETNLIIEKQVLAKEGQDANEQMALMLSHAGQPPVKDGADPAAVAWEIALKATNSRLDARVSVSEHEGIKVHEFRPYGAEATSTGRYFICLDAFTLDTAKHIGLTDGDALILRGDKVDNAVTLTLAPRLRSKLILLERVAREVSF